jgi:predicted TIM-barrel fold metal-dependent hydrolase
MLLIDAHTSIGMDFWRKKVNKFPCKMDTTTLLKLMKKNGIEKSIILPAPTNKMLVCPNQSCQKRNKFLILFKSFEKYYILKCPICGSKVIIKNDPYNGKNKTILKASKKYKGRFIPFIALDIRSPQAPKNLQKFLKTEKFFGVKIFSLTVFPHNFLKLMDTEFMDIANENSLTLMFHSGIDYSSNPIYLVPLIKKYKNVNFIIAHCARFHKSFLKEIRKKRNVFVETSLINLLSRGSLKYFSEFLNQEEKGAIKTVKGAYEFLIEQIGREKVLFGTDIPAIDIADYEEHINEFKKLPTEIIISAGYENTMRALNL